MILGELPAFNPDNLYDAKTKTAPIRLRRTGAVFLK
jgi:hypothetical protein